MSIVVMVDSGASISKNILKKYEIELLPYDITFSNGDCYRDIVDVKNQKELVNLIDIHEAFPKIDQIDKDKIENYFKRYIENGYDILYISVSSKLSHAYKEVLEVSKKFDESTISVIDSLNVGSGETSLALYAKDYVNKGYGLKQTTKYLNHIKHLIKSCYAVGNALYLYSQKRCADMSDKYLEFYNRVPVAEINEGNIVLTFNAKVNEVAIQVIKNILLDYSNDMNYNHLIISYSGDRKAAVKLKEYANKILRNANIEIVENSSVVFINTGNNTLSLAFLLDENKVL